MLHKSIEILNQYQSSKFLIAVSGGVDSMVLLHLFQQYKINLSVVHCNFQLRGEDSDKDEEFIKDYCSKYDIPIFIKKFDTFQEKTNQESIQMVARRLRYQYFKDLIKEHDFFAIATAHHADDNIETFFINLLRGSGLQGLSGMKILSHHIFRPLLNEPKEDIIRYATFHQIPWREDISNQKNDYLRNTIRQYMIPELKKIEPDYINSIQKSQSIIQKSYDYISKQAENILEKAKINDKNVFLINPIKHQNPIIIYEIFKPYGFDNEKEITKILSAKSGSVFNSHTHQIIIDRQTFKIISLKNLINTSQEYIISLPEFEIHEPFSLKGEIINNQKMTNKIVFDLDKIEFPMKLRTRKEGDYFYPLNGNGRKKLSKYFKDEKIPQWQKDNIWLLCDKNDQIIWVIGYKQDDRFKVEEKTVKILNLILQKNNILN